VPGRGSGHSEHRPKPARTEVSPSARPQPGNYGCLSWIGPPRAFSLRVCRPDPGTIRLS
jgi:hypothetical protein